MKWAAKASSKATRPWSYYPDSTTWWEDCTLDFVSIDKLGILFLSITIKGATDLTNKLLTFYQILPPIRCLTTTTAATTVALVATEAAGMTNAVDREITADMVAASDVTIVTVEGKMNNVVDDKNSMVAEGRRKGVLGAMIGGKSMVNNVMAVLAEGGTETKDAKRAAEIKEAMVEGMGVRKIAPPVDMVGLVAKIDVKTLVDMAVAHLGDKTATTIAHQAKAAALAAMGEFKARTKTRVVSPHLTEEGATLATADQTNFPMRPSMPRRTLANPATRTFLAQHSVCLLETKRS